ncbi:PIN domain-containing protein [Methylosinus sp. sav-2]|uniref:PIN-like domain-containing protein n=1 Tax=Methylosinus sp. sav-2 TaxID=2485168 RepID=UPI0010655503|nr:PIN domain-containing protein [Methylosinus sp. sav-2]
MSSPFRLEAIYEDLSLIFTSSRVKDASSADVVIAVDTNVLLLPYTIRKEGLPTLQEFYIKLRAEKRLFLPARVAREFIGNRDKKLAELLKTLSDIKSRINIGETKLSPILEGVEGSEQLAIASKALSSAKEQYTAAIGLLEDKVRSWNGDDPVTNIYSMVFDSENIIVSSQDNEEILKEWEFRLTEQIPPGYKDSAKSDTGIGDFLIWKSLLYLAGKEKKDLIFVTGEEKADWFVRVNGGGAYPRPELIAEYRKFSGGKNIRLASFHDVLREMAVSQELVSEVEHAENTANNAIRSETNENASIMARNTFTFIGFNIRYGGDNITFIDDCLVFTFNVSERSVGSLWVYPNNTISFREICAGNVSESISIDGLQPIQGNFAVKMGEIICAQDAHGNTLIAKLISANLPKPNEQFLISFAYAIYRNGSDIFVL